MGLEEDLVIRESEKAVFIIAGSRLLEIVYSYVSISALDHIRYLITYHSSV